MTLFWDEQQVSLKHASQSCFELTQATQMQVHMNSTLSDPLVTVSENLFEEVLFDMQ